ncbi:unnamed protein product [Lactuca saligna]|uniref:RanBP2-type domain-containing protein n=1 Tax=Lactuca saligna TaxID=75948 RepID=A0AA35ZDG4_LACSI|nr:unnamed protein product [Lactuca saligna]
MADLEEPLVKHRSNHITELPLSRGEDLQSKCLLELHELKKSGGKAMQTPEGYLSVTTGHYVGYGPPSSMYISVQPYGSSLSMPPPYDVHVPSAYHYSYGIHLSGGSNPYRPLPPLLWWLNHRVYDLGFIEKRKQRKVLKTFYGKSDNDWVCPNCGNVNFSFRIVCNMRKCNTPKPGSQASMSGKNSKGDMHDGS